MNVRREIFKLAFDKNSMPKIFKLDRLKSIKLCDKAKYGVIKFKPIVATEKIDDKETVICINKTYDENKLVFDYGHFYKFENNIVRKLVSGQLESALKPEINDIFRILLGIELKTKIMEEYESYYNKTKKLINYLLFPQNLLDYKLSVLNESKDSTIGFVFDQKSGNNPRFIDQFCLTNSSLMNEPIHNVYKKYNPVFLLSAVETTYSLKINSLKVDSDHSMSLNIQITYGHSSSYNDDNLDILIKDYRIVRASNLIDDIYCFLIESQVFWKQKNIKQTTNGYTLKINSGACKVEDLSILDANKITL